MMPIKRKYTKKNIRGYQKPTPKGKFIPDEYLCLYCHKGRIRYDGLCIACIRYIQWGHAAIKWCRHCNTRPVMDRIGETGPTPSYCEDCVKVRMQQFIVNAANDRVNKLMPKLKRKDWPQNDPVPKSWHSKQCWHCNKMKGSRIPIESPFCVTCYTTTCQDCSNKAFYVAADGYKQWCKQHYYERIICHSCGSTKQLDGLTLCDPCRLKRTNLLSFQLKKLWRRTPYACKSCESAPRLTGLKYCTTCYTKIAFSPIKQRQQPGYQYELPFA